VFAWTQNRILLPSWYGAGTALAEGDLERYHAMNARWPFFATLVSTLEMALFKTDLGVAERYLRLVDERSIPIPAGYRERLDRLPAIQAALAVHPLPRVPCHNDLLAENYIREGERLRIVDYEYSGNNDPTFELGNTCQELSWDDGRVRALCAAYFGAATDALVARMRLQMIMSDVGWTLWAAIQASISTIDYDFGGWAEERWDRARAALDGPDFGAWLAAVRE